jgi:hypothetical protein
LSFARLVTRRQSFSLKLQLGRRLEVFDGDTGAGGFQIDRLLEIIAAMNTDRLPAIMLRNGDRIANRMVLVDPDAILSLDRHIGLFIATAPKQIVAYAQIFRSSWAGSAKALSSTCLAWGFDVAPDRPAKVQAISSGPAFARAPS